MNFGLLPTLPHVTESRHHYDAMLTLDVRPRVFIRLLNQLKALIR
ncbi:hypothetical protein [Burkholderia sp. BCC0044]|nr:hypothetical protein [Burkholderia sp. BCC0044]